jgi:hypothetical protein
MTDPSTHDHPARTIAKAVAERAAVPIASVTATRLGEHLGLTRQRIGVLADIEHVIERLPNGRFDQDQSRLKYLAHLRSPERRSARSEAAAKHTEAKTKLGGLPARVAGTDLVVRRRAEAVLRELRTEIANACLEMANKCNEPPLDEQG